MKIVSTKKRHGAFGSDLFSPSARVIEQGAVTVSCERKSNRESYLRRRQQLFTTLLLKNLKFVWVHHKKMHQLHLNFYY